MHPSVPALCSFPEAASLLICPEEENNLDTDKTLTAITLNTCGFCLRL